MHAGILSDTKPGQVAVEIFNENRAYNCRPDSSISCYNNGIKSKKKKAKTGFRFVDSASSCKYFKEEMGMFPFFLKWDTQKGETEFQQIPTRKGMIIQPVTTNGDETVITNCSFECGNARYMLNISINDFGKADDSYIGAIFR